MPRPTRLRFETLEARDVPTVFGNPWLNADRLTLSFAPNGVSYSNQMWGSGSFTSNLFGELSGTMAANVWQEEILRALYAWTAEANVNVGLTADDGRAFGPAGMSVSGTRGADLRVGAIDQSPEVLATNMPFHPLTGFYAGNLMLNGNKTFSKGGANGTYDLYTVALHEFGNILGLADKDADQGSGLDGNYTGPRSGLKGSDRNAIQAMYGVRPNDAFEGANGNNDLARASALAAAADPANATKKRVVADGNVTTTSDVDVYKFTTPAGTTNLTVRLGTAGKSLLAGKIEVLDATGKVLAVVSNTSPLQGDAVLTLTGAKANATYYVRVSAGRNDAFAVGTYQLRVGFNYDPVTETKVDPVQRLAAETGLNELISTATTLTPTAGYAAKTHYLAAAKLSSVADVDFYKLTAPTAGGVMTVSVQGLGGLSASATVYSAAGAVVASNVVLNWEGGLYRAQVPAAANAVYYVKVVVQDPGYSSATGDYFLDVDFKQPLAARDGVLSGTAVTGARIAVGFDVAESRAFSFALTMTSGNVSALNGFAITIYDSAGAVVADLWTDGKGSTDTLTAFLKKGKYTIVFKPDPSSANATANFNLSAALLSDPIDVYDPSSPPPPPTSPPFTVVTSPPASPPPPGYYDPWSHPVG